MKKTTEQPDTVKMSVTATRRFQRICNMLAGMKGISRDQLIERAVMTAFAEEIAANEAYLDEPEEEPKEAAPTAA
jgi:hypothetical protein